MIDVIITWPKGHDYPTFRQFIRDNSKYFTDIYVSFTWQGPNQDYRRFLKENFENVKYLQIEQHMQGDWRNNSVNLALDYSKADYVLFLEQDFLIYNENMIEKLTHYIPEYDFIYFLNSFDNRKHPAFILASRKLINLTSRDFSASPPDYDHFGLFTAECDRYSKSSASIQELGFKEGRDFEHLAGLTQNMHLFEGHLRNPDDSEWLKRMYFPERFRDYINTALSCDVVIPEGFIKDFSQVNTVL